MFVLWAHGFAMSCSTVYILVFPALFIVLLSWMFFSQLFCFAGCLFRSRSCLSYHFLLGPRRGTCAQTQMPVSQLARLFVVTPPRPFLFLAPRPARPMLCPQGDAGCHKAAREATSHHVMPIAAFIIILVIVIVILVIVVIMVIIWATSHHLMLITEIIILVIVIAIIFVNICNIIFIIII